MRIPYTLAIALVGTCASWSAAQAAVVYVEDFNSGFQGSQIDLSNDPVGNTSDRYDPTRYYSILDHDGWSFSGTTPALAVGGAGNGAVLLNEPTGAGMTVIGLSPSSAYSLSFTYWGDNRPGETYTLNVSVNGTLVSSIVDTDKAAGTNPGTTVTVTGLNTDNSGNLTLLFTQGNNSEASPIFDDVTISNNIGAGPGQTPLPAALPLFGSGLAALGALGWRRKRKNTAAHAA
jgi:hypothetical protein